MNIFALLIEGEPISYSNNLLTIGYKEGFGFHKEAVSSPQNKEFVEEAFSIFFKKKIDIRFIMVGEKATIQKMKNKVKIRP